MALPVVVVPAVLCLLLPACSLCSAGWSITGKIPLVTFPVDFIGEGASCPTCTLSNPNYCNHAAARPSLTPQFSGVASDNRTGYYFSNMDFLLRTGWNVNQTLAINPKAITLPHYDHIGDIDYYKGEIYVGLEEPAHTGAAMAVYDGETLNFTGRWARVHQHWCPWVAVDAERQLMYSSEFPVCDTVFVYRLEDFAPVRNITLDPPLKFCQGGAMFDGRLYITSDLKQQVFSLDVDTGELRLEITQDDGFEIEGIAFANETMVWFDNGSEPRVLYLATES